MNNLELYSKVQSVPENAKKTIGGGRLKGMTDINPMWRIKMLTELFGPCGIGWKYTIDQQWIEQVAGGKEAAGFCNITLYIKNGDEWSAGIPGTGGSGFVVAEKNGVYMSDEVYKMALTDAISVACKALGFGADVYWQTGRSKYTAAPQTTPSGQNVQSETYNPTCVACGAKISDAEHDFSVKRFKKPLCRACQRKESANA